MELRVKAVCCRHYATRIACCHHSVAETPRPSARHNRLPLSLDSTDAGAPQKIPCRWGFKFEIAHEEPSHAQLHKDIFSNSRANLAKSWSEHCIKRKLLEKLNARHKAACTVAGNRTAEAEEMQPTATRVEVSRAVYESLGAQLAGLSLQHQAHIRSYPSPELVILKDSPLERHQHMAADDNSSMETDELSRETASVTGKELWDQYSNWYDPRFLVINLDNVRDGALDRAHRSDVVVQCWSHVREVLQVPSELSDRSRATLLALAWTRLCNAVRTEAALPEWGADCGQGLHVHVADRHGVESADRETNKPAITIWSACPMAASGRPLDPTAKPSWHQLCGLWEIKLQRKADNWDNLMRQCMHYMRRVSHAHLITGHMHMATMCGGLVRLWRFDTAGLASSRAYDLLDEANDMGIMQIIALISLSDPAELLSQWTPVPVPAATTASFTVRGAPCGRPTVWVWQAPPQVLFRRPSPFGNKTTTWVGIGFPEGSTAKDLCITFVKASCLSTKLQGHEAYILRILFGVASAPRLLGTLDVGSQAGLCGTRNRSKDQLAQPDLALDCLAVQHHVGQILPYTLSEYDLTDVHSQFCDEVEAYSLKKVHYRDVHNGNVMFRWEQDPQNPTGRPRARLVLIDFGNARNDWRRRGGGEDDPVFWVADVAEDDCRSGNDIFLPSSVSELTHALQDLKLSRNAGQEALSLRCARTVARLTHRYIDDLDSSVSLQLWHGCKRGCDDIHEARDAYFDDKTQRPQYWRDEQRWATLLDHFCGHMSQEWRNMMKELRACIATAQAEVRAGLGKLLEDRDPRLRRDLADIQVLLPREEQCFADCRIIYERYLPLLSKREFPVVYKGSSQQHTTRSAPAPSALALPPRN